MRWLVELHGDTADIAQIGRQFSPAAGFNVVYHDSKPHLATTAFEALSSPIEVRTIAQALVESINTSLKALLKDFRPVRMGLMREFLLDGDVKAHNFGSADMQLRADTLSATAVVRTHFVMDVEPARFSLTGQNADLFVVRQDGSVNRTLESGPSTVEKLDQLRRSSPIFRQASDCLAETPVTWAGLYKVGEVLEKKMSASLDAFETKFLGDLGHAANTLEAGRHSLVRDWTPPSKPMELEDAEAGIRRLFSRLVEQEWSATDGG